MLDDASWAAVEIYYLSVDRMMLAGNFVDGLTDLHEDEKRAMKKVTEAAGAATAALEKLTGKAQQG